MKIDVAEWKKTQGYFEDKKAESFLTVIPKLYKAFVGDQSSANERILANNIAGLKKEIARMSKEHKADRPKLTAIGKLEALVANGEEQIQLDRARHTQGLQAHLKLRTDTITKFNTTHRNSVKAKVGEITARIAKMKNSMKAKDRDEVLTDREFLLGLIRDFGGIEEAMKQDMIPVRVPTGNMKNVLIHLSGESKRDVLIPKTNELFQLNKALLTALGNATKDAQKWAENAQKLGDAWAK
jgi:hypothetical protein